MQTRIRHRTNNQWQTSTNGYSTAARVTVYAPGANTFSYTDHNTIVRPGIAHGFRLRR
jgi:hypothetical protein